MPFYKRFWDEERGDQFSDWGTSTYYFETDDHGDVKRQIEIYSNGKILRYDEANLEDSYGSLSQCPLDMDEFSGFEIPKDEFEHAWLRK